MTYAYLLDAVHLWDEQRADDLSAELAAMAELYRRRMVRQPCTRWGRPPRPSVLLHMLDNGQDFEFPHADRDGGEPGPLPRRRWAHAAGRLLLLRRAAAAQVA